jgi:hypothetical protein
MSRLSKDPFNLFDGQLLTMRGNGPYQGRYYYNWEAQAETAVDIPQMNVKMVSGDLVLQWNWQAKALAYEIFWNTKNQKCGEFVKLTRTKETIYTIPKQFVTGKMEFQIRAINQCNVGSAFSK